MTATMQELGALEWVDFEEQPIVFANHFLVQHQPNEFVLTLGQVTGPPVVGLTRPRVLELINVLQATLEDHDRIAGP